MQLPDIFWEVYCSLFIHQWITSSVRIYASHVDSKEGAYDSGETYPLCMKIFLAEYCLCTQMFIVSNADEKKVYFFSNRTAHSKLFTVIIRKRLLVITRICRNTNVINKQTI